MPLPEISAFICLESTNIEPIIDAALDEETKHILSEKSDHESGTLESPTGRSPPPQEPVQAAFKLFGGDAPSMQQKASGRSAYDYRRRMEKRALQKARSPGVPRYSNSKKHQAVRRVRAAFDARNLPAAKGTFVSRQQKTGSKERTLDELLARGFKVVEWDGHTPTAILDNEDRIITILAGRPQANDWDGVHRGMSAELAKAASAVRGTRKERRGNYTSLSTGVSYGGGQTAPGNLVHNPANQAIVDKLKTNGNFIRAAGFMNSCFSFYAPKISADYRDNINALLEKYSGLKKPFSNSIFPACTFNCGRRVVTLEHVDSTNVPYGLCAILSCGSYDPVVGGHLVLFSLGLVIQFPPGSTVLLPSGTIRHGNVPIRRHETRQSFTQFCPGGLLRWVAYGFQSVKAATPDVKEHLQNTQEQRRERALGLFSKVNEVDGDRARTYHLKSSR